ncbi:MAG TPA: hypothetical protein PKX93_03400 [bacterium]|nr:hypothetical protein [bacterium]HOL66486.1 hypothetical protein [bacterium]HPP11310.1 hypothetical protein [bacterium]
MERYIVTRAAWQEFLRQKAEKEKIFGPVQVGSTLQLELIKPDTVERVRLGLARPVQPLKFFLLPYQEQVLPELSGERPSVILGATACDLKGLKVLDQVFSQGDFKDPNYIRRRDSVLIVSVDCGRPLDVCFCESVGGHPYPEDGFDINLTVLEEDLLLEVTSPKASQFLSGIKSLRTATEKDLIRRSNLKAEKSGDCEILQP